MKLKKLVSTLLIAALSFSLVACAGLEPSIDGPDPNAVDVEQEPVVDIEPVDDGGEEVVEDDSKALYDGKIVIDEHFEEGDERNWFVYTNGGDFSLAYEDGEMIMDIVRPGNLDYSCQAYWDGFELNMGGVYDIQFDIRCDIERPVQWRFQLNGGDYHAYYGNDQMTIGPETTHVAGTFTMNEATDPAPRMVFNAGYFEGMDNTSHKIYIDNIVLTLTDATNAQAVEPLGDAIAIKVNQVGYKTDATKIFVATSDNAITDYNICDSASGNVVYSGKFGSAVPSNSGDGDGYIGNFSDFKEAGTYYISVAGLDDSYEFTIADDVLDSVTAETVRMLYLQRCGMELTSDLAGDFAHPVCHSEKARVYGTDQLIDVSGGWHDAGDYGRYVVAGAKTIADLFLTYEEVEGSHGDDYAIPESGNGVPDILDEARYELEFMLKMQADNGGVYHKVTCAVFPETVMPEFETDELIVSPISTAATGDFAAVMAKASIIYREYDAAFADKCLAASKKAFTYMEANAGEDFKGFTNPEDIVTGEYPDKKIQDEWLYAAVELYIATGESVYHDRVKDLSTALFKVGLGWADMGTYAIYDYLKADVEKDDAAVESLTKKITENAELSISKSKEDPFASSLRTYPWGSNMSIANAGILYRMMYNLTGNEEYNDYAKRQVDYLLGVNPAGYCYVTAYGTLSPEHPHHRPSQAVGKVMPGMLVGGPNSDPADPYAKTVLLEKQGGCCYVDNDTAYSVNEITIYWNSPLIYLLELYK